MIPKLFVGNKIDMRKEENEEHVQKEIVSGEDDIGL